MRDLSTKETSSVFGAGFCPACYYGYIIGATALVGYAYQRYEKAGIFEKGAMGLVAAGLVLGINASMGNSEYTVKEEKL